MLFDMDNTLFDLVGAQVAACESVVRHLEDGFAIEFTRLLHPDFLEENVTVG